MKNYLKVVSDSEGWSESKKKLYRSLAFTKALGYNIEDYSTVEMDYEFDGNTYDFGIHADNLELLIDIDKDNTTVPTAEYINKKPLAVISARGKVVQIAFRLLNIKDVIDLENDEDALIFIKNTGEGRDTLKNMLDSAFKDNEIFNEFVSNIKKGIIPDVIIDVLHIDNREAFKEKFQVEMQKFTSSIEKVQFKDFKKDAKVTNDPFADKESVNNLNQFESNSNESLEVELYKMKEQHYLDPFADKSEFEESYTSEFEGEPQEDEDYDSSMEEVRDEEGEDLLDDTDNDDIEPVLPKQSLFLKKESVKTNNHSNLRIPSINDFDDDPFA